MNSVDPFTEYSVMITSRMPSWSQSDIIRNRYGDAIDIYRTLGIVDLNEHLD